ncbi:hypothetical protein JHJ32_10130 [Parapedobacter sp. ISTM3]|uniref:Uncharacterized protein n=1 Tax=Parapedobacter luteus TaxID=623280 RepID=A0A1T5AXN6_9SPHI|nr:MULTISPECIES: hypothetical protein [Parapedobacter]MBK1440342.1 hypothetical protein [Parapedobacter sp. ISTM3]SKB39735.1 hypothetical protein SAMN05660226_01161 [Parapedobacter luteus]
MKKEYHIANSVVPVRFEDGLVRITNGESTKRAMTAGSEQPIALLVRLIRKDYHTNYGKPLAISDDSFSVEIVGHLLAEFLLLKYSGLLRVILLFGLYDRFRRSCEVIDCGEAGKDPNRWFWDKLSPYRGKLAGWLPKAESWPTETHRQ